MKAEKRYLFPADFMADPSVHVFDGKIYIYPSHDWECENVENDNGDQYVMKDMHVLSIDGDPMTGTVTDGKYYLYFPLKDKNDIFRIGVAIADKPEGPFIPQPDPIRGSYSMDICVFEENGVYYLYFGG